MEVLSAITELWLKQIKLCTKAKQRDFGHLADRVWHFYGQTYAPLNLGADENQAFPEASSGQSYEPTLNKSWEFVALMMPYVHAKVPHRTAVPRRPPLPMELAALGLETEASQEARIQDRLRAWMMQFWLNYTPTEGYDLSTEIRTALPQALVMGRGLLWHELIEGPHELMPASLYGSVDDLLVDADCEQWRDAGFIIRRRKQAIWRIAEEFGLDANTLRGQYTSHMSAAAGLVNRRDTPAEEKGDVGEYFEVWSRMGPGHKLVAAPEEMKDKSAALDALGPHVWLAVMPGVKYPLNLKPDSFNTEAQLKSRAEWPLAFFEDPSNPFPVSRLDFFPNHDSPWATTPLKGGLPWQIFLDRMYHYMKARVRTTCRDIIVCADAVEESLKKAIESGADQEIVTVSGKPGEDLSKLIEILSFPPVQRDVWQMMQSGERMFEQATGMSPLMYGSQGEGISRSAEDIRTREGHVTSRPDDMADIVESWMSAVASKEAQATRLYVPPPYELFGEPRIEEGDTETQPGPLSQAWSALVSTDDPADAASQVSYSVESGSGRRKNKQKQMADVQQLAQTLGPELYQYGVAYGNFGPHRALIEMVGEAYDVSTEKMMLLDVTPEPPEDESKSKSKGDST